jgi:hypothetical protein
MDLLYPENSSVPRKKVFPGLGGIKKNSYRKGKSLKISLNCISKILSTFIDKSNLKDRDKTILNEIKKDLLKLSKY